MRTAEPDIRYLFEPRSIVVMGRWKMGEVKEGDRIPL
jgi:hypothetical protein